MRMRLAVGALCALAFSFALTIDGNSVVDAVTTGPCDFLTGGGYINPEPAVGNKANFAVAGGCKGGSFWGHLQYQDKLLNVKVHSVTITGYQEADDANARLICGTGKSDDGGDVDFIVRAKDAGEPGSNDEFDVQITLTTGGTIVDTTFGLPGVYHKVIGGNVQLHKPNPSNAGKFGGCPPMPGGGGGPFTLTVTKTGSAADRSTVISVIPVGAINCTESETTCSTTLAAGTMVELKAQGPADQTASIFWSGDCDVKTDFPSGPAPAVGTCTVTMNANKNIDVLFTLIE